MTAYAQEMIQKSSISAWNSCILSRQFLRQIPIILMDTYNIHNIYKDCFMISYYSQKNDISSMLSLNGQSDIIFNEPYTDNDTLLLIQALYSIDINKL